MKSSEPNQRIPGIDGLRALAALSVFLFHAHVPFATGGGIGVDVFFVISGFVITRSLLPEVDGIGRIDIRAFYMRRALRLWPALTLTLAVFVAFSPDRMSFTSEVAPSFFYYANWTRAFQLGGPFIFGHTWTLAVEEQFYLIFPLLFLGCGFKRERLFRLAIALVAAICVWRAILFLNGHSANELFNRTDTRCDAIFLGVVLALVGRRAQAIIGRHALLSGLVLLLCIILSSWTQGWLYLGGFTAIACSSASLLSYVVSQPASRFVKILEVRPLARLGVISYGFYLWHYPLLRGVPPISENVWIEAFAKFSLTLGCATISWFFVERPVKQFVASRSNKVELTESV